MEQARKSKGRLSTRVTVHPTSGDPAKGGRPSGMVVIRLVAEASPVARGKVADTLVAHAKMYALKGLSQVLDSVGSPESYRLVRSIPAREPRDYGTRGGPHQVSAHYIVSTQYWRLDSHRWRSRKQTHPTATPLSSLPEVTRLGRNRSPRYPSSLRGMTRTMLVRTTRMLLPMALMRAGCGRSRTERGPASASST